jgi:hypothetical protein
MLADLDTQARLRIRDVESIGAGGSQLLLGAALDSPRTGDECGGQVIRVSGWVLGRSTEVTSVEVVAEGDVVKALPLSVERLDVASYYAESAAPPSVCGFHGLISVLPLAPSFELGVQARLADGRRAPFGTIGGTRSALESSYAPSFAPLVLTSLGRSGSTLVMDLLRRHPAIVVAGGYPYEFRAARYWFHQLAVLSQPADHAGSAHPDTFHETLTQVGANPFFDRLDSVSGDWFAETYPDRLATFLQRCMDDLYREIALSLERPHAQYFAEKHVPDRLQWVLWDLYPRAREVFLVRDFRDMLASILAFNEKRGYLAFGRESCGNDLEYVDRLAHSVRRLADAWVNRADTGFLLRYEDLVRSPDETLYALAGYLGLKEEFELEAPAGAHARSDLEEHRTTASGEESIERWRRDLPAPLVERCNARFADALRLFGYPLS